MRSRRGCWRAIVVVWAGLLGGCSSASAPAVAPDAGAPEPEAGTVAGLDASTIDATPGDATPPPATPPATDLGDTAPIAFGNVDCGATATPQLIVFHNLGGSPLTFTAQLASGAAFSILGGTSGTLAPNASGTLTIAPLQVAASATAGTALTDTLNVATNAPDSPAVAIAVSMTPQGGSIQITPTPLVFPQSAVGVQAQPQTVTIKNVGTRAVSVGMQTPSDAEFTETWSGAPAGALLAPGKALAGATIGFKATSVGAKAATIGLSVQGALCAPASPTVQVTGEGI